MAIREDIGTNLVAFTHVVLNQLSRGLNLVSVAPSLRPKVLNKYADLTSDAMLERVRGDGVPVITDVYGLTPGNLARHYSHQCNTRVVSGINLPILLRVLNYAH